MSDDDVTEDAASEPETTDAPEGVADVENVPEEAAPDESEATEDAASDEPAEEQVAQADSADEPAAEAAEELTAEAADPQPDEPQPAEPVAAAPTEGDATDEAAPAGASAKRKRKRLPRSLRPQKTRRRHAPSTERKAITRLPKPEHARGRRQERQGTVVSAGSDKTIVVRVDVVKVHPMYKKVVKRSTKLHAHDETNEAKVGDVVRLVETRPLSKMKRWRLQEVVEAAK
jgi:small subunit ribosomal protein S17